uniref:LIM zinc-binding domain-containing protein n=1 Tax=Parastrongyloides trichosuri TaxID=131310 RepID=A0A0N4ZMF9_PARTI
MPSKSSKTRRRNLKKVKAKLDISFKKNDDETRKQVQDLIGRHTKSSKDFKIKMASFKRDIIGGKYSGMSDEKILEHDQKIDTVLKIIFPGTFQKTELSTQLKCALCFQGPNSWKDSGELYGPTQANIVPMLIPKEIKLEKETKTEKIDLDDEEIFDFERQKCFVAFHEKCILEAEGTNIVIPQELEKLGYQLETFWKTPCKKCKKLGAFVRMKNKIPSYIHYHCNLNKK